MADYRRFSQLQTEGPEIESADLLSVSERCRPLEDAVALMKKSGAEIVSIGEGSHGTKEFYAFRCEITKQLIRDGLCNCVLIEGDWPDTAELHRYVMGMTPSEVPLNDLYERLFMNFPRWMWRNETMRDFILWLREWNATMQPAQRCGIFGLDVYSLHLSMSEVLKYLREHSPETAELVVREYSCFDKFGDDAQTYAQIVKMGLAKGCRDSVVSALKLVSERCAVPYSESKQGETLFAEDENFIAQMNARVIVDAERYYTSMFDPMENSWNIRDTHFFDTLVRVRAHLLQTRHSNRVAVWAYNSHLGDARYAHLDASSRAVHELNIGELINEKYGEQSISVGQLTYTGTVMAAHDWGSNHKVKQVRKALPNSYEEFFHLVAEKTDNKNFTVDLRNQHVEKALRRGGHRLERAIGVIYRPQTERHSHYYFCDLAKQFDILCFFDETSAVKPLDKMEVMADEPETFPSGL